VVDNHLITAVLATHQSHLTGTVSTLTAFTRCASQPEAVYKRIFSEEAKSKSINYLHTADWNSCAIISDDPNIAYTGNSLIDCFRKITDNCFLIISVSLKEDHLPKIHGLPTI